MTTGQVAPASTNPVALLVAWGVGVSGFSFLRLLTAPSAQPLAGDPLQTAQAVGVAALGVTATAIAVALARFGTWRCAGVLSWWLSGVAVLSSWGLLHELVMLLTGQVPDDLWSFGTHVLAALGAVLLARLARSHPFVHTRPTRMPTPSRRAARAAAALGSVSFLPYVWMKTVWATGGSFAGRTGAEVVQISAHNGASELWQVMLRWGLDPTAVLACLGVLLLWALVQPWGRTIPRWGGRWRGRTIPRWLLLGPALLGSVTLLPYGLAGIGYASLVTGGVLSIPAGDFATPEDNLLVAWIGLAAFAGFGAGLSVTTWRYWALTRRAHQHLREPEVPR